MLLRQSTARTLSFGPAVSTADGFTVITTLSTAMDDGTTGIRLSKNGAAFAARHAAVAATSYDALGNYLVVVDTTDTGTLGYGRLQFTNAAILPVWQDFEIVTAVAWDAFMASSGGFLPNASANGTGGVAVIGTGANQFKSDASARVDIGAVNGTASAASALSFASNDTNNKLQTTALYSDWNGLFNATASKALTATTIQSNQTFTAVNTVNNAVTVGTDNATSTRNTNIVSINSSASAASALSFATNDTNNRLTVTATRADHAGIYNATASQAFTATTMQSNQTFTAVNSVINAVTVGTDNATSTRNTNVISINSSASAASALSFATNDTNNRLTVTATRADYAGIYNSTASQAFTATTIQSNQTFTAVNSVNNAVTVGIDNATSTRNANVLSINGSTSAASALSFATNDTNNRLTVTSTRADFAGVYNSTASQSFTAMTIKSDQTFTAVNSVVNGVAVSVDNATSTRNSNVLTINGTEAVAELTTLINSQTGGTVTNIINLNGTEAHAAILAAVNMQTHGTVDSVTNAILLSNGTGGGQIQLSAGLVTATNGGSSGTTFNSTQLQQITDTVLAAPSTTVSAATSLYAIATANQTIVVNLLPTTSTAPTGEVMGTAIDVYQNSAPAVVFIILNADDTPTNLQNKTVRFTASRPESLTTPVIVYDNALVGGVTVSGADHNVVTVQFAAVDTATLLSLQYSIENVTDEVFVAANSLSILPISQLV